MLITEQNNRKETKQRKKHAIDVVIVVQWNNHGNDIKKDWTEDFIDDFPDKEEDDDYDGDDKSHESCQRRFYLMDPLLDCLSHKEPATMFRNSLSLPLSLNTIVTL